jgi:hypothetical protein
MRIPAFKTKVDVLRRVKMMEILSNIELHIMSASSQCHTCEKRHRSLPAGRTCKLVNIFVKAIRYDMKKFEEV